MGFIPKPGTTVQAGTKLENPETYEHENPVVRWMADNVQAIYDANKNIKLDKSRSTGRILER